MCANTKGMQTVAYPCPALTHTSCCSNDKWQPTYRYRARTVQSYSPGGAHTYPHLTHGSLGPHESAPPPNGISIGSAQGHDQHTNTHTVVCDVMQAKKAKLLSSTVQLFHIIIISAHSRRLKVIATVLFVTTSLETRLAKATGLIGLCSSNSVHYLLTAKVIHIKIASLAAKWQLHIMNTKH